MHADSTPPGVFEFLDATHRRVDQHLKRLRLLVDRIAADGLDHAAQKEAREVLDFFNSEARQHHLDEEKHIFPALLASGDDKVVHAARSLTQDHGWLEENWLYIEPIGRQALTIAAKLAARRAGAGTDACPVPYEVKAAVVRVKTTSCPLSLS